MKKIVRNISMLALALLTFNQANAQNASYTTNGGLAIGFGLGASYQGSDIANSIGSGFDFWLGHQIYRKENSFLAADWKFRFLAAENQAFDHRENPDGTYSNIRYSSFSYDLELGLTLNRLRERTRIVITGFVGAGITHGRTFADLYDSSDNLYDFSVIDPGKPVSEVKTDLMDLSDMNFETALTNKGAILPTAGLYIGYQFSPAFSMGIEHKTNFSLNENNGAFGINIDNIIASGSGIDRNHYTTLGFRWSMGRRYGGSSNRSTTRPGSTGNYQNLEISPVTHKTEIPTRRETYVAKIDTTRRGGTTTTNVSTGNTTRLGGTTGGSTTIPVTTNTNVSTGNTTRRGGTTIPVTTNTNVSTGNTARTGGTTRPVTSSPVKVAAPEIRFLDPSSPLTVDKNQFLLRVQTRNVAAWQDVEVLVNGLSSSNFSFSREGLVVLNMGLKEGENSIVVTGKNESGQQSGSTSITYKRAAPVTTVTNPVTTTVTNPVTTTVTNPVTTTITNPVTTTVTNPVTTTVTNPVTTTVTNPVTTTVTNPVTTTVTNPVTTTVTNPVTTTVTNPVTTTVTNPVTTTVTNPVTTTVTNPVTTTVTNPVTTTVTNPVTTTVTNPVTTTVTNPVTTTVTNPVTTPPVDKPCGVRINPGNSDWEFCLVTPNGSFNRGNLSNNSFSYSGSASSLYFKPIGGGGDALVNGKTYALKSGQYYLFTGNLTVTVSTKNPGSMGQWSVCISSNKAPVTGNGNNRPASPCQEKEIK